MCRPAAGHKRPHLAKDSSLVAALDSGMMPKLEKLLVDLEEASGQAQQALDYADKVHGTYRTQPAGTRTWYVPYAGRSGGSRQRPC